MLEKQFAGAMSSPLLEDSLKLATSNTVNTVPMAVLEQLIQQAPFQSRAVIAATMLEALKANGVKTISPELKELLTTYTTASNSGEFEWIYPRRRNSLGASLKRAKAAKSTQNDIPGYFLG